MLTKGKGIRWSVTQTPHLIPFAEKGRSITVTSKAKEFVLLEIAKRLFNDYEDVCKRDLKALVIDINGWETLASERSAWRQAVQQGLSEFENTLAEQAETKRQTRKARNQGDRPATDHICSLRGRDCHVIPELVFSATQGAVREPPIRGEHHRLSRLKDANICLNAINVNQARNNRAVFFVHLF